MFCFSASWCVLIDFHLDFPEESTTIKVDFADSLGSLRRQLGLPRSEFRLYSDGDLLRDDHRSLLQLGLDPTSQLVAAPKTRTVAVRQRGAEPVSLGEVRRSISWNDFLEKASAALNTELAPGTRFLCACGRVLSNESARRRKLARRCCDDEELLLTVHQPLRGESRYEVCYEMCY